MFSPLSNEIHIEYGPFLGETLFVFQMEQNVHQVYVRLFVCTYVLLVFVNICQPSRLWPYHDEHTRSRPIMEVKYHLKNRH